LAIELYGDDGGLDNWIESWLGLKEGTADEFRMAYNVPAAREGNARKP
jgi:hypothetical protein